MFPFMAPSKVIWLIFAVLLKYQLSLHHLLLTGGQEITGEKARTQIYIGPACKPSVILLFLFILSGVEGDKCFRKHRHRKHES